MPTLDRKEKKIDTMDKKQKEILTHYPRLCGHMICESLGYFTPEAAANAVIYYKENKPFFCEWYSDISRRRGKGLFDDNEVLQVGKDIIKSAFRNRHGHRGYMAEYRKAQAVIRAALKGEGPIFASWF